jgi:hypothetical protein
MLQTLAKSYDLLYMQPAWISSLDLLSYLRQNTQCPRDSKQNCVETLLFDAVVLKEDTAVCIYIGPGVLDLRSHSRTVTRLNTLDIFEK